MAHSTPDDMELGRNIKETVPPHHTPKGQEASGIILKWATQGNISNHLPLMREVNSLVLHFLLGFQRNAWKSVIYI